MSKIAFLLPLPLALSLGACETIQPLLPPPPEELDLWADADAGVADPALAQLCRDYWEALLRNDPFHATYLGDPRHHGRVPDPSLEGRLAWKQQLLAFQERLRRVQLQTLYGEDPLTAQLLRTELADGIARVELGLAEWTVDPLGGPQVELLNLAAVQPHENERQRAQLVDRWESLATYVRAHTRNLERGRLAGKVASKTAIEKTIAQLDLVLAVPPPLSPLVAVATDGGRWVQFPPGGNLASFAHQHLGDAREQGVLLRLNPHLADPRSAQGTYVLLPVPGDELTIEQRGTYVNDVLVAVEDGVYPALTALRTLLSDKLLPAAREDERPGISHVAGGAAAYRTLIHLYTSLPGAECDPKAIHEYGLSEVQRIREEMASLGQGLFGTSDLAAIQDRLRNDPAMHFRTREEVVAKASEALARARTRLRGHFGLVPHTPCEVVPIPDFEERASTIAYYREPSADGSRPGRYYVNTYAPETRPRYEAEVLAFHEAIPGHHLQIAIAQEREELPRFRRHFGCTAYAEGWALYTERLCDEMGLYSGDLDRMGVLSFDAWRAARLVVDTGLHALGWTRDEAIEYLFENTLLARNNVETEVDRYIAWPGQALAYKLGQREFLALRDQARAALGPGFRLADFHDRVLANGAVTLEGLRGVIGTWLGDQDAAIEAAAER
ncbi:MAG TPA: DUF885 domain-containing protein [Planctomycetota bacterium]